MTRGALRANAPVAAVLSQSTARLAFSVRAVKAMTAARVVNIGAAASVAAEISVYRSADPIRTLILIRLARGTLVFRDVKNTVRGLGF